MEVDREPATMEQVTSSPSITVAITCNQHREIRFIFNLAKFTLSRIWSKHYCTPPSSLTTDQQMSEVAVMCWLVGAHTFICVLDQRSQGQAEEKHHEDAWRNSWHDHKCDDLNMLQPALQNSNIAVILSLSDCWSRLPIIWKTYQTFRLLSRSFHAYSTSCDKLSTKQLSNQQ